MNKKECSVLFLGKENDACTGKAVDYCRLNFTHVGVFLGKWGDPLPVAIGLSKWDYIVSYLSRWIVPEGFLNKAKVALNFHPGPPEYPGYGCNNFAIYEGAKHYGVTCHRMAPRVDTGAIIAVRRFPVLASDDAGALLARSYEQQLALFYEIMGRIIRGEPLPESQEKWTRKPFTRKQFSELGKITPDMSKEEIARRVRATTIGVWKPRIELHGFVFELKAERDD